jgi:4-amino-4-deoxy-L-arabinose transferase-like glycosyltransferase
VAVLALWGAARAAVGPAAALPAAFVLATAFEWTRAATSARVDMALAAPLALLLAAWLRRLAGGDARWLAVAAAGATLATLAKGPVALVLPALAAVALAAWERDAGVLRRLGVVPVLGAATVVAGAWYAVAFAEQGRAFVDVVLKENVVRFIDSDDARVGHTHGVFYLPILGLVGLLPWVPLLGLARAGLRAAPERPLRLATVWGIVVFVFFSLANAKRSVYLLPAVPALALLVGAGATTANGTVTRRLALVYLPALVLLTLVAAACAAGVDASALVTRWLKPDDARGATAVVAAVATARPLFVALGAVTLGGAVAVEWARRRGAWRRVVLVVAGLAVLWTAVFDACIHPAIARTRSVRELMAQVDRMVPATASIATAFPVDPGLRFYAPRPLVRFDPAGDGEARYLLLWEDEWRVWRAAGGEALRPLAVSRGRQAGHGALALVLAPPGRLERAAVPDATGDAGLRTGNRSP